MSCAWDHLKLSTLTPSPPARIIREIKAQEELENYPFGYAAQRWRRANHHGEAQEQTPQE